MLCTLQRVEIRPRESKLPFYICTWNGVVGDPNAPKFVKGADGKMRVNLQAAKARNITLIKSIFPVDETALAEWWELFQNAPTVLMPEKAADGTYVKTENGAYKLEEKTNSNAPKICLNLVYEQVPLSDITDECKAIRYTDSKGIEHTQTFVTVIGFADDNDTWAEEQTPTDMAKRNFLTNVESGVYKCLDESDSENKRSGPLPTMATVEDLANAVKDGYGAEYSRDGLKLLSLPKNIKWYEIKKGTRVICDRAFEMCRSLREVVIPDSVTYIGDEAFRGCSSLREAAIPASVTSIESEAFSGCHSLREVVIHASVTSIGNYAFYGCSSLREAFIPASVTSIGDYAFYECSSLREVVIPDSVTDIGNEAFGWCSSLREVVIPDSVTSIGDGAFLKCSSLQEAVISDSVTSIGYGAFSGCSSLREVVIPDSVTSIEDGAFLKCSSLQEAVISDSVTSIGYGAFSGCSSLSEVIIPASVTSIGYEAFSGCPLSSIIVPQGRAGRFRELLERSGCDLSVIREQDDLDLRDDLDLEDDL